MLTANEFLKQSSLFSGTGPQSGFGSDLNLYLMTLQKKSGPGGPAILENCSGGGNPVVQTFASTTQYKGSSKLRFGFSKPYGGGDGRASQWKKSIQVTT